MYRPLSKIHQIAFIAAVFSLSLILPVDAYAADCQDLPTQAELTQALKQSIKPSGGPSNGGLDLPMWAAAVNRAGEVCVVARSGDKPGDQWPGSRVISAQKANTANAFSLPGLALATANLWSPTQPGGSLFGLQLSNPVDPAVAYAGKFETYGTAQDPLKGKKVGGVNVFGGGLALYGKDGRLLGAMGVSGDTSCADHNIAWRVRAALKLDKVPGGVNSANKNDGIIYDLGQDGKSAGGFGHPLCGGKEAEIAQQIGAGTKP
jgi:uncharacterized protein GlcG (DUF336 family)